MRPTTAYGLPQVLDHWEAVPVADPLVDAGEAARIRRPWTSVCVPGHWQLEGAFAAYEGIVLYRSRFVPRAYPRVKAFSLLFGGAYYSARVWLNGAYLGSHEGYFAQFEFDCTHLLRSGTNELLVEVNSPRESGENDRQTLGGVWAYWDGMDPRDRKSTRLNSSHANISYA